MKIGIDLDGTVVDMMSYLCNQTGYSTPCRWDAHICWGIPKKQSYDLFDWLVREYMFIEADPVPDSIETLKMLEAKGHSLHVITNRSGYTTGMADTEDWLRYHGVHDLFESFHFAKDKTIVDVDLLIDDKPSNCLDMVKAGKEAILIGQPWNVGNSSATKCGNCKSNDVPFADHPWRWQDVGVYRAPSWKYVLERVDVIEAI